jgi:hypothetical protein
MERELRASITGWITGRKKTAVECSWSNVSGTPSKCILRKQLRFPEIAATHPPDTFCAVYGRAQCITTTCFDGHHPTDKIQRVSGPPGGPEIRQQHRRRSQRRIWGQELAPSRPQPTTHGGYGRNTTGGLVADDPRVVPLRPRACGGVVLDLVYRRRQRSPVQTLPAAQYHG